MLEKLNKLIAKPIIRLIRLYQMTLSPDKGLPSPRLKGRVCMHTPHCSKYSLQVLKRYGFWPGIWYAVDRVLHCTGGMEKIYDPAHHRIVFFSSAPIGVPFLQGLEEDKRFEVVGVVTQCDKPAGRGMQMCECVVKSEAKRLFPSDNNTVSKVILIHGKDATPQDKWYPKFIKEMQNKGIKVLAPALPNSNEPVLKERLQEIEKCNPDENTILIGHSRGGVAILRRLEQLPSHKKVRKVILVATNDGHSKYMPDTEKNNGFYTDKGYDFEKIKTHCNDFVVFHSTDDERVDYEAGVENAKGLDAKMHTFTDKNHFGKNLTETGFPELIEEIEKFSTPQHSTSQQSQSDFIQTPMKLNPEKSEEGRQFAERLTDKKPDFLVVIAYGKIIPQAILDIPNIAPINVHGSLLPKYRGASPIQSCLLNDDKETGITIMKMDAEMDTGDMIDKLGFKIGFDRTSKNIIERMQTYGPKFLNDTLWKYGKGMLGEVKQDNGKATYCTKIEKESGQIDSRKDSLHDVYCKYRAYAQWPKIYFTIPASGIIGDNHLQSGKKRIIVEEIKLYENIYTKEKDIPLIYENNTLNEAIEHLSLKPEGKKAMGWKEFLNGYLQ